MGNLVDMMERVKCLKNGVGIQSLLDSAYRILGNPIMMFDTKYALQAYTPVVTDDPIWNEIVTNGTFSVKTQELFKNEGFIEAVANAKRITFMISEKLKYDRILGKVFNNNNTHVANLVIIECNKSFEPHDSIVFEAICKLITREVSNSEFYQAYEKIYQETLIKNLIDGNIDDRELYAAHVSIIYNDLKANLYLAVADISQCDPQYTKLVYFRDLFEQVQSMHKYVTYANYILIVISTGSKTLNVNKELNELNKLFEQNNIYAGISGCFENMFELQKYYMEALNSLNYGLRSNSNQRIFPYDISSVDKMKQIRELKNGMGVQYLLNEALKILGNPVLLQDMEFNFLACTENVDINDPVWEEFMTYGTLSDETIDFFQNEGFVDAVVNTKTNVILSSDKLKYDRITGKIYNKDSIMVACLIMVACNKPLEDDVPALFGAFCETLSKEVSSNEFYNNYGQEYSETLVSKLIEGNINEDNLFSDAIANIYDNLKSNLYLVVADISECAPEHAQLAYFRSLLKDLQTVNRYAVYSKHIIIIISSDNASLNENKELHKIDKIFEQHNIYAGMSGRFGNIYELRKRYNEAVNILNNGLKNK